MTPEWERDAIDYEEGSMLQVNYYYDRTDDHRVSDDAEGDLVALCATCARHAQIAPLVQYASRGDEESICGLCDWTNGDGVVDGAMIARHAQCREAMIAIITNTDA